MYKTSVGQVSSWPAEGSFTAANATDYQRFFSRVGMTRAFVIVEKCVLECLIDLTADFGVKTNAKLTSNWQLHCYVEKNW